MVITISHLHVFQKSGFVLLLDLPHYVSQISKAIFSRINPLLRQFASHNISEIALKLIFT
jgi:hypothetical protein